MPFLCCNWSINFLQSFIFLCACPIIILKGEPIQLVDLSVYLDRMKNVLVVLHRDKFNLFFLIFVIYLLSNVYLQLLGFGIDNKLCLTQATLTMHS